MSKNKSKASKSNVRALHEFGGRFAADSQEANGTDLSVFVTVFLYCVLIIFLPVATFFGLKTLFESLELTSVSSNVYSAVGAIISLHIALGVYLYKAYKGGEKPKPKPTVKQD